MRRRFLWPPNVLTGETTPLGLFTAHTSRGSGEIRFPATATSAVSSTSLAGSVTTSPPTLTLPAAISSSAERRDATPAGVRYWASLSRRLKPSGGTAARPPLHERLDGC